MRARIYHKNKKKYYISEIYGILNCGIDMCLADEIDDQETIVLVENMDFSSEPPYDVNVEKIDINSFPQFKWIDREKEEMENINHAIGEPGKIHYFSGYDFVWEQEAALIELIQKGCVDKKKMNMVPFSTKLPDWNYIETQKDIDLLMEKFAGFHDSVLKELQYISGDYVAQDGGMLLSEAGDKKIRVVFDSQWAKSIEMLLLAPRYIQLVPPAENYLANLYDASLFIKDCMVYFYDSYLQVIPKAYDGTCFAAMGVMWRVQEE